MNVTGAGADGEFDVAVDVQRAFEGGFGGERGESNEGCGRQRQGRDSERKMFPPRKKFHG
jgi:hypothetical protein